MKNQIEGMLIVGVNCYTIQTICYTIHADLIRPQDIYKNPVRDSYIYYKSVEVHVYIRVKSLPFSVVFVSDLENVNL
jgi:hypothetical protein